MSRIDPVSVATVDANMLERVLAMDLDCVLARMMSKTYELLRWPESLLAELELQYRRFFYLLVAYPHEIVVPTKEIDEMWHNHILFTKKYMQDCQDIAGHYLHHFPEDQRDPDPEKLQKGFENTKRLYLECFGEPLHIFVEA